MVLFICLTTAIAAFGGVFYAFEYKWVYNTYALLTSIIFLIFFVFGKIVQHDDTNGMNIYRNNLLLLFLSFCFILFLQTVVIFFIPAKSHGVNLWIRGITLIMLLFFILMIVTAVVLSSFRVV